MIFKNTKLYDVLKYLALIVFDACGLAYEQLAEVWNLPYGTEVMRTFVILSTFAVPARIDASKTCPPLDLSSERK